MVRGGNRSEVELAADIRNWDGKSNESIESVFKEYKDDFWFATACLECLEDDELQSGASWLLKKFAETDGELSSIQTDEFCETFSKLKGWSAKLHVLQTVPFMKIEHNHQQALERFVRHCLADRNKMVRAWALNGFFVLANHFPEYQEESSVLLEAGLNDESPAVRARARNILKTSEFLKW